MNDGCLGRLMPVVPENGVTKELKLSVLRGAFVRVCAHQPLAAPFNTSKRIGQHT